MKLLQLYTSVLKALGHRVTDTGLVDSVSVDESGKTSYYPALIDGLRLILPTPENMRKPDTGDTISFHPMWEDVLKGPSVMIEYIRKRIIITLGDEIALMALQLLVLISEKSLHEKLTPDQMVLLDNAKGTDEQTVKRFSRIIKATEAFSRERSFIHVYLRRGAKLGEEKFRQASIVTFPFYEAFVANPKKVFGVELRKVDQEAFKEVMEYLLPRIATPDAYSFGSNSDVAPKFEALAGGFDHVLRDLLEVDSLLKSGDPAIAEFASDREFDLDWTQFIGNTAAYLNEVRMIPKQRGCEGAEDVHTEGFQNIDAITAPSTARVTTQATTPASTPASVASTTTETVVEIPRPASTITTNTPVLPVPGASNIGAAIRGSVAMRHQVPNPIPPSAPMPAYQPQAFGQPQPQSHGLQFVRPVGGAVHPQQSQFPVQNPYYQFGQNVPYNYYGG